MLLYRKLKYLYLKKRGHSEPFIQDAISEKTGFKPYEIVYYRAEKEINHYTFGYRGVCYDLLKDKLKVISEDDI